MSETLKIALVTGASRGIGKAIALALGKQGFTIAGTATTQEGADTISHYLKEENIQGHGFALNVCDREAMKPLLDAIQEKVGGSPLVLVNNAGITRDNIFLRMKPEEWDSVIDTNLTAIYRVTKACLKPMVKARWGRVINITSVVGVTGNPGQANYTAAKAGMIGMGKSLAQELAVFGITVNCVAPGFIDTDMTRFLNEAQQEQIKNQIPMKRMGEPSDIANAVAFLASDQAGYITGQTIHVNGGMCMI